MKKVLITTVALALAASMLASCSNGTADTTATTFSETTTEATTTAETSETTTEPEGIGGPVNDETGDSESEGSVNDDPMSDGKHHLPSEDMIEESVNDDPMSDGQHHLPLKDRYDDAVHAIEAAMQYYLEETYGDKVYDARFNVKKILSYDEEQAAGLMDLGVDKLAFEIEYELKPKADASQDDINALLAGNGEYDKESGWISGKSGCGVLEPNKSGKPEYVIKDLGTGF